jgi:hypothetical protein
VSSEQLSSLALRVAVAVGKPCSELKV